MSVSENEFALSKEFRNKTLAFVSVMQNFMDTVTRTPAYSEQRMAIYRSMNQMLTAALTLPTASVAAPSAAAAAEPAAEPAAAAAAAPAGAVPESEEAVAARAKVAAKKVPKVSLRDYGYAMAEGAGKRKEALDQAIHEHSAGIVLERLMDLQDLWADNRKPLYLAAIREDIQYVTAQI